MPRNNTASRASVVRTRNYPLREGASSPVNSRAVKRRRREGSVPFSAVVIVFIAFIILSVVGLCLLYDLLFNARISEINYISDIKNTVAEGLIYLPGIFHI